MLNMQKISKDEGGKYLPGILNLIFLIFFTALRLSLDIYYIMKIFYHMGYSAAVVLSLNLTKKKGQISLFPQDDKKQTKLFFLQLVKSFS